MGFNISMNPNIMMKFIFHHLNNLPWDIDGILQNPNLNLSMIKYINQYHHDKIDKESISINKGITMNDIDLTVKNPEVIGEENSIIFWNWHSMCMNPNFTMYFLEKYSDKNGHLVFMVNGWNYRSLSHHQNLTEDIIQKYPHWPWVWEDVSSNGEMSSFFIENHPHLPWDLNGLSKNPSLTLEFIKKYDKKWNSCQWFNIGQNKAITLEIMALFYREKNYFQCHHFQIIQILPFLFSKNIITR